MAIDLDTPVLDGGIASTNFFNGRLLSSEDLSREQDARRFGAAQLGRAAGEGVVEGFWVSAQIGGSTLTQPLVTVKAGLAVNRLGQTLELPRDVDVSLLGAQEDGSAVAPSAGAFAACTEPGGGVYVAGTGVYLLAVCPASRKQGRAPASGLGGIGAPCTAKEVVDGVQFHLVRLDVSDEDLADEAHLRNAVAYGCFGESALQQFGAAPYATPPDGWGLVDELRPSRLADCDVPLAVVHWTDTGGIRFADNWSVRRRCVPPPQPDRWEPWVGPRRAAECEAMALQLDEHLGALSTGTPQTAVATDIFLRLPPAGAVPLGGIQGSTGFAWPGFFAGVKIRATTPVISAARAAALLRLSRAFPPIDLSTKELVWLYFVAENQRTLAGGAPAQPYAFFTSPHMPYAGDARFDVAHFNLGNIALP